MAGLCAAAEARSRGADVLLLEKATAPGGSMLLSSGVVWRHEEWHDFRAECPGGDEALQRLVWERLDEGLGGVRMLRAPGGRPPARQPPPPGGFLPTPGPCPAPGPPG